MKRSLQQETTRQEGMCLLQPKAANMSWADLKPYWGFCQIVQAAELQVGRMYKIHPARKVWSHMPLKLGVGGWEEGCVIQRCSRIAYSVFPIRMDRYALNFISSYRGLKDISVFPSTQNMLSSQSGILILTMPLSIIVEKVGCCYSKYLMFQTGECWSWELWDLLPNLRYMNR